MADSNIQNYLDSVTKMSTAPDLEARASNMDAAREMFDMFSQYQAAGFSEQQAFELVRTILNAAIDGQGK
jgi:hypothetical protein